MSTKRCGKCGNDLPIDAFPADKRTPTGLAWACRVCVRILGRERQRRYRRRHRDKILIRQRADYQAHKEERRAYQRNRYAQYREAELVRGKQYRQEHKVEIKARRKHYYAVNKERLCEKAARWREENRDKLLARRREMAKTAKGRAQRKVRQQRRNARKAGLDCRYTLEQWLASLAWFGNQCAYCGASDGSLQQDHVIPIAGGGAYVIENIVPACARCNGSKHDFALETWVAGRGLRFVLPDAIERVAGYFDELLEVTIRPVPK